MNKRLKMIAREDKELSVCLGKGLGMINMLKIEKRWLLLLSVIHAGRSMLCGGDETYGSQSTLGSSQKPITMMKYLACQATKFNAPLLLTVLLDAPQLRTPYCILKLPIQ
jgi:hypothetical protein